MYIVKTRNEPVKLWTCPKCGRQFKHKNQTHSCRSFDLKKHFEGKAKSKLLYERFREEVKRKIGSFKIESLECCIHFVNTTTFAAIRLLKEKVRVEFSVKRKIDSKRIIKEKKLSVLQHLYFVDLEKEVDIDEELMEWIQEANDQSTKNIKLAT